MNIKKAIVNVKAFFPKDKEICKILEICDLQPLENNWMQWVDINFNKLSITENKNIICLKSTKQPEIIKDIHFKAPIKTIANNSKWAMISFARNNECKNICFIWMITNDNKLKSFTYFNNEWLPKQFPLDSGLNTLRIIVQNLKIDKYKIIDKQQIRGPITATIKNVWATKWKPNQFVISDMLKTNKYLAEIILEEIGENK